MTLVHLLGSLSLLCALVFVSALLTWRRALARRAGMLVLAGLVIMMLRSGAADLWFTALLVSVTFVVLLALSTQERQPAGEHLRRMGAL
jgi:hypothetical protein